MDLVYIMLLLGMSSENYRERETANYILKKCGPIGVAYAYVGIHSSNLETSVRCRPMIRDHLYRQIGSLGQMPWLDMLPHNYPDRWRVIAQYMVWGSGPPWHQHKQASWHFFTDQIVSHQMTLEEARGLIDVMHERGRQWCKENNHRYEDYDWNP